MREDVEDNSAKAGSTQVGTGAGMEGCFWLDETEMASTNGSFHIVQGLDVLLDCLVQQPNSASVFQVNSVL